MRFFRFFLFGAFLMLSGCAGGMVDYSSRMIPPQQTDAVRLRHLDAVNTIRAERGLGPLAYSASLNAAASTHARDMSVQRRAWHFGSDGTSPQDRADRAGYPSLILGENISETFEHEVEVLQSWLDDPDGRGLILDPKARMLGFSWFQESDGKLWWVQVIGS
ncbi:MAG: CAP domain-containing protein [Paracoccaceae bacterium]